MSWRACVKAITEAVGRPLSDDEIEGIASAVQLRLKNKIGQGLTPRDAAGEVGKEISGEMALKAMLQRRDAANNILKFADLRLRTIEGKEVQASRGVLSGWAASGERNVANSVDATHHTLRGNLLAPALAALDKAGLLEPLKKNDVSFNKDVARELRRRNNPDLEPDTGNKQAKAAAAILGGVMDTGRAMLNKAGAFIGELEGYMGRQYHDMWKIRGDGSEDAARLWIGKTAPRLDLDTMYPDIGPAERLNALRETWQALSSGVHDTASNEALNGFQGGMNLGKKVSQSRSLLFKDADSWFGYNEDFGKGSVMDAVFAGADGAARDTAIMQTFGTNPKMMWDKWQADMMQKAYDRGDFKAGDALKARKNDDLFNLVAGRGMVPGNATLATVGATVRNTMQLLHLGQILGAAISHIPINASLMRANGGNFWNGLAHQIRSLVPPSAAQKEIAASIHAGIDGMMGHIIQRFRTEDGVPGKMSEAVNQFHKWNGFGYYMDAQRQGIGLALSNRLAFHAGKEWEALDPMMQNSLRRYGIEKGEWDTGRASTQAAADGRNYLIPSSIADEGVAQKFQTYITDSIREGMNEPTPWARQLATLGTRPGTWGGETVRAITQFKSFAVTMMERQAGRIIRNGDIPGAIYLVAGMTLAGYAGMTLRDLVANKAPRMPQNAEQWAALVRDAAVAGGGIGLMGDIFLRGGERSGADMMKSLAGPAPSTAFDAAYAINSIIQGPGSKSRPNSARATRMGIAAEEGQQLLGELTPNHPFIAAANAYLLGHVFREMVSPGATHRYNALLKDKGQTQVMRPALQN